jgi:poly(3-hydroxybutyrate) depolymerase
MRRILILVVVLAATLAAAPAGVTDTRMTVGQGSYVVHRPPRPGPWLVVVLHSRGASEQEPIRGGWSTLADQKGFIVVYPIWPEASWNAGLCCPQASTLGRDDGAWLAQVIADARARYHPRYLALAGTSNGAMMAESLVWRRPWLTSRVAVWAGAPEMIGAPSAWSGRVLLLHGALDTTVPWAGTPNATFCSCPIRPAQQTRVFLPAAHIEEHLLAGYRHTAPSWWPAAAWTFLSKL